MNIGLIAHDNKKKLMENLCIAYRHILCKHDIFATGTTGRLVEEATGLPVQKYLSARLGGEQQMGAQIANNDIDLMIFLRDPVSPHSYESQVNSILHLCDIHNIPLATNLATAEVMLLALDRGDLDWRNVMK
ncbi:MAG: methylglyoxal synthase [Anaerotignum sp.]|nr:methylglyoxal synthase [Anaerotignum sp.]MBR5816400.1 methylglyoxal synthase [Anaerotignum sp.]